MAHDIETNGPAELVQARIQRPSRLKLCPQSLPQAPGRPDLPETQQEMLRLSRDVEVNTALYTTLLNNSQQLKIVKAGKVGNVRIIDRPLPVYKPIKPKKKVMIILGLLLGAFVGVAIAIGKFLMVKGVTDSKEIEASLGLPVYATLPHSDFQKDLQKKIKQKTKNSYMRA